MTEADVILWTGVAVGLLGLAATASNGVALILRVIRLQLGRVRLWIRHWLALLLPHGRTSVSVTAMPAGAGAGAASATGTAFGTVTAPADASVEVQLEVLRGNLASLQDRVGHIEQQSQAHHADLSTRLDALTTELREGVSALTKRLGEDESNAARTDARGLGPVAFGFTMTAVPAHLASVALVGWVFMAAALIVTGVTAWAVFPGMLRASRP